MLYAPYVMLGKFTSILLLLFVLFSLWSFHACGFMFSLSFSFVSFFYVSRFQPRDQWRLILVQGRLWRWTCSLGCGGSY